MKFPAIGVATASLALFLTAFASRAQETFDAITYSSTPGAPLYAWPEIKGVGLAFQPSVDLRVIEVGSGNLGQTVDVKIWNSERQSIGGGTVSSLLAPSGATFQQVTPFILSAGSRYYVSAEVTQPASMDISARIYYNDPPGDYGFDLAPQIFGFYNYVIHASGEWLVVPQNSFDSFAPDGVYLGPTFRFEVVPEPSIFSLGMIGVSSLIFSMRRNQKRDCIVSHRRAAWYLEEAWACNSNSLPR